MYIREESAAEKKAIRIATFFVKVDAKNMGEVAILSSRINDANIETTSKKSKAQEVETIYALQDKSEEEKNKILTPKVSNEGEGRALSLELICRLKKIVLSERQAMIFLLLPVPERSFSFSSY
jgi:hypothetical protein